MGALLSGHEKLILREICRSNSWIFSKVALHVGMFIVHVNMQIVQH